MALNDSLGRNGAITLRVVRATCSNQIGCFEDFQELSVEHLNVALHWCQLNLFRITLFSEVSKGNMHFSTNNGWIRPIQLSVSFLKNSRPQLKTVYSSRSKVWFAIGINWQVVINNDNFLMVFSIELDNEAATLLPTDRLIIMFADEDLAYTFVA